MGTKAKINEAVARVEAAEQELRAAKDAHREAFRVALVALCNEYGLAIEAGGTEGAHLEIRDLNGAVFLLRDLDDR